jgi:hypothetical protein
MALWDTGSACAHAPMRPHGPVCGRLLQGAGAALVPPFPPGLGPRPCRARAAAPHVGGAAQGASHLPPAQYARHAGLPSGAWVSWAAGPLGCLGRLSRLSHWAFPPPSPPDPTLALCAGADADVPGAGRAGVRRCRCVHQLLPAGGPTAGLPAGPGCAW